MPLPEGIQIPTLTYEKAHSGQEPFLRQWVTMLDLLRQRGWMETTSEQLFQKVMVSQESLREGGFMAYELRRLDEERGLRIWKTILENQNPKPEELRHISNMLDQLLAGDDYCADCNRYCRRGDAGGQPHLSIRRAPLHRAVDYLGLDPGRPESYGAA